MNKSESSFSNGGWSWKPDRATRKALTEGNRKYSDARRQQSYELFENQTHSHTVIEKRINDEREARKAKPKTKPERNRKMATKTTTKKANKTATQKTAATKKPLASVAPQKKAAPANSGLIPLKSLLPDGMDPRKARIKLRKAAPAWHDARARWEFTDEQAKEVREILKIATS